MKTAAAGQEFGIEKLRTSLYKDDNFPNVKT